MATAVAANSHGERGLQDEVAGSSGLAVRLAARRGGLRGATSGLAHGYVQANLAILPRDLAADFMRFCHLNPKPCPLLAAGAPGDWRLPSLGENLDVRADAPRYRVFRHGELIDEPTDVSAYWRDDLVTFAIGCSHSFEEALIDNGIKLRHIAQGTAVPMYRTSIMTAPAGPFHGPTVVSMRPLKAADAIRAIQITTRFPSVHGAPIHLGAPDLIGIRDVRSPDYGEPVPIHADELPVFWACGVTPQAVVVTVKPEFCITHYPGSMLVTDRRNSDFAVM